jgi:hypothetical protein
MIIRTANGSLMKVTEMEGQRMMDEHPFDYYFEPDGCEICVESSWTTQEIKIGTKELIPVRMCYQCYMKKGGSVEGWNDALHFNLNKEVLNG